MANSADLTDGSGLQQYLILAKSTKGKAATAVIQQALSAPNIYVFGELLEMPNVQQLGETEDKKFLDLLKIFAYGTYADYKANSASLPALQPSQIRKLQQLTIVTLSNQTKSIPYALLQKELEISEVRELEDVIIDAIYQGIIQGKLDQKTKHLHVEFAMGRDLKPDSLEHMLAVLTQWSSQAELLLKNIKEKVNHANLMTDSEKKHKEEFEKRVENVKQHLKAAMEETSLIQAEFEGIEGFEDRARKGRGKKHGPPAHRMEKRGV